MINYRTCPKCGNTKAEGIIGNWISCKVCDAPTSKAIAHSNPLIASWLSPKAMTEVPPFVDAIPPTFTVDLLDCTINWTGTYFDLGMSVYDVFRTAGYMLHRVDLLGFNTFGTPASPSSKCIEYAAEYLNWLGARVRFTGGLAPGYDGDWNPTKVLFTGWTVSI